MRDDLEEGMELDLPPDQEPDVEELDDGGALVPDPLAQARAGADNEFDANLAETLDASYRHKLARRLLDLLERDADARRKRDEAYEEGLRLSGLDRESSVGADFEGASRAVHPALAEASVEFAARAMKELFPASGPVRTAVMGESTKERLAKAERKRVFLNWQLTQQMPEYRDELEQLLPQTSLGGSQFLKFWWDCEQERPRVEYVPADKVLLPFSASSFRSARRKAHVLELPRDEVEARIESGMYRDFTVSDPAQEPEPTKSQEEAARIEGKEPTGYNEDGTRRIYEVYCWEALDDPKAGGKCLPYIITIDETSQDVLAVYRNWDEKDRKCKELQWLVEWPFIPWRGALTVGLVHLIGGLTVAATGALNALLDSAHVNNVPTAVALKGSRLSGQSRQVEPTTIQILEGPAGLDDIRKLMMPLPYNPPSPVLLQLLGWLTDAAKGVVTTASEKVADSTNTGPVGTTYALIEQGAIIFSTIHARLHTAQRRGLEILCRLNSKYLTDEDVVEEFGELITSKADFVGPMDVIPVSDPHVFSETQRWAQLQAVFQLSQDQRVQYDVRALHTRALDLLRFPRPEEVLPDQVTPQPTNPVAEHVNATKGLPLMAFPHEDHMAHLREHLDFLTFPAYQVMASTTLMALWPHIQQHLVLLYAQISQHVASQALGKDVTSYMLDPASAAEVDGLLADAIPHVQEAFQQLTGPIMPQLMQVAQQAAQQAQQSKQQPLDPQAQVALQVGMADVQRRTQRDQIDAQIAQAESQRKAAEAQSQAQIAQAELQLKQHVAMLELQVERMRAEVDRQSEFLLNQREIQKNDDDNRTKEHIEQMRLMFKQMMEEAKLAATPTQPQPQPQQGAGAGDKSES